MTDPRITFIRAQLTVWGLWRRKAGPETIEARRIDSIVTSTRFGETDRDLLERIYVEARPLKAKVEGNRSVFFMRRRIAESVLAGLMEPASAPVSD